MHWNNINLSVAMYFFFCFVVTAVNFPMYLNTEMGWLWSPNAAVSEMRYSVKIDLNVTACNVEDTGTC